MKFGRMIKIHMSMLWLLGLNTNVLGFPLEKCIVDTKFIWKTFQMFTQSI